MGYVVAAVLVVLVLDGGTGLLIVPGILFLVGYGVWSLIRVTQARYMSGTYHIQIPGDSSRIGYEVIANYSQGLEACDSRVTFLKITSDTGETYDNPGQTPDMLHIELEVGKFFNERRRKAFLPT